MEGAAVLLVCVFLGLTDIAEAQTTTGDFSTLQTTTGLPTNDACLAPWTVNVSKDFTVRWDGLARDSTVFVNVAAIESYGDDCLNRTSFTAEFDDKEAPPIPKNPCFNSVYQVDIELRCNDYTVAHNYSTQVWTEPDKPTNVRVTNVTTSSFRIEWNKPPGIIEEYKVRVDSFDANTTDTYLDLRDLLPFTKYRVQISARNKFEWGKWSEAIWIETKQIVPFEPKNVTVIEVDSVSIKLEWDEPTPSTGPIKFYTVEWTESLSSLEVQQGVANDSFYVIEDLTPLTSYDISVSAATEAGIGNWTPIIQAKTKSPTPPENLRNATVSSNSVSLEWDEPRIYKDRGIIDAYSVRFNKLKFPKITTEKTKNLSITIDGLDPKTMYMFEVQAWTKKGPSEWSQPLMIETYVGVPDPPEKVYTGEVSDTSIQVKWDIRSRYKKLVILHTVEWSQTNNETTEEVNVTDTIYLIENLDAFTNYLIRVKSWTEDGAGGWAGSIKVQTAVGVPLVPVNIREDVATNISILVKWDEPFPRRGPVEKYFIKWHDGSSKPFIESSYASFFLIKGLTPYQNYSIQVCAKTKAGLGNWSEPIIVQTKSGIPYLPRNIKEDKVTNTTILVKWNEPKPTRGPIETYSIRWREGFAEPFYDNSSIPSYLIEGLTPYQSYSIQVSAKTSAGFGYWSDPISVRTKSGIPFIPEHIREDTVTNTTILVKWSEPRPVRGPIEKYLIKWQEERSAESTQKSSNVPFYLMEELTPCRNYFIQVSAKTEAGLGNWSEPITVSTTTGLPMVPKNVEISFSYTHRLEIRWEEPEPHMGNILAYNIRWGERGSDLPFSDLTNETSFAIKNLAAYTWYTVQVQATTEAGHGEWSESLEGRTAIGIPSLPRDFREKKSTNTTIEIEWVEPNPTNGPITHYAVKWAVLDDDVTNSIATKRTSYLIKDLKPYTNYSIRVRASTEAGFGKWTAALVIRTDIGVPLKPRNVATVTVTDTSIHLKWEEPEPVVGSITHYDVECVDSSSNFTVTGKVQDQYHIIKKLSPYRNYTIRIRAATSAGSGGWSDPIFIRTLSGVPLPPTNIEKEKVTNLTICIKWREPSPFKGPVLSYTVRWMHVVSKTTNNGSTKDSPYCIQNLEPYSFYDINVQAKTSAGFGDWSDVEKIRTAVGIPAAIKHFEKHNKTAWTIFLSWSPPNPSNGPLKVYEIKWGEQDGRKARRNLTENTFFAAANLIPYTRYSFEISASTEVGFGPPSVPLLVQTDIAAPSAPVNLGLVSASNISLNLKWKEPVSPNGPILNYTVTWKATYGEYSPQVFDVKSLQYKITGLVPYMNYSVQVSAKTSAGTGPWSEVLMAGTKIGVPKPAEILSIDAGNSKAISMEWKTFPPYPGPTNYVLEVWRKPSKCYPGYESVLETFKNGSRGSGEWRFNRPENFEELTPYSEYYVRVLLKTTASGNVSSVSPVVKTLSDSPGAPRLVEAECKESTETLVRWKSPVYPNGKIIEYLVRYGVEYSGWKEEVVFVEDECQENHSLRLGQLRPERKYKIYVRAKAEGVEENGAEASIRGHCVLPAGIPPVDEVTSLNIHGSGPHMLILDWTQNVFSDTMGDIIQYAVIVGVSEAVGNATRGRVADAFPSWANYSDGFTSFYQATPQEWNPFNKGQEDPLCCKEIKPEEPESKIFVRCTIGVDKECSSSKSYCNGPLKPDTRYGLKLRAFTRGGFSETDPLYTTTDPIKEASGIVGVIVGVVVVFLMVASFVVFTLILKRKGKIVELRLAILSRFGRQPTAPQLPAEQVLQLEVIPNFAPLTIQNFADHVRLMMSDSHLRFSQEFENLKKNSPKFPCTAAEMDENRPKNRWLNIFPYDHSRVKLLPLCDEPGSDFVNANYVPGYLSLREYIATQGPLANTVDDFWRMVWEQSVSMIVMLTQCVERGKNKCEQYWPDAGEAKHYGDMQVRTISESMLSSYVIRLFHVQLGSQERRVKQMHFTHWPDFGCPECPDDLINFIRAVRDHLPRFKPGPIIVHCSAGVGRTGTFIAVDRLSQQIRAQDAIDIFGTVMELRHHRINMVQTEDQYIYIHLCVKQLVDDINEPQDSEYEEAIYSNVGLEKDTGV